MRSPPTPSEVADRELADRRVDQADVQHAAGSLDDDGVAHDAADDVGRAARPSATDRASLPSAR